MLTENIPAVIDAIQDNVRLTLAGQNLTVVCPNTGDDVEVRFDDLGRGVLRNERGEVIARFEIAMEYSIS